MRQLQIQVFVSLDARREDKVLFERCVNVDDSLVIPFQSLYNDLKFMFGADCIVTFSMIYKLVLDQKNFSYGKRSKSKG